MLDHVCRLPLRWRVVLCQLLVLGVYSHGKLSFRGAQYVIG